MAETRKAKDSGNPIDVFARPIKELQIGLRSIGSKVRNYHASGTPEEKLFLFEAMGELLLILCQKMEIGDAFIRQLRRQLLAQVVAYEKKLTALEKEVARLTKLNPESDGK